MFRLSDDARKTLERNFGMSLGELAKADEAEQTRIVESKIKKPLVFPDELDPRKIGRGNPLLAKKRYKTMDEVNKRIDSINKEL